MIQRRVIHTVVTKEMTTWNQKGNSENSIVGISVDKNDGQPT